MGTKDPTPKADGLRAMREAKYLESIKSIQLGEKPRKLIPYAGKDMALGHAGGAIPYSKNPKGTKPARVRKKLKRKTS